MPRLRHASAGEPAADLHVAHANLQATEARGDLIVRAIDEFPIFAVAATQAHGATVISEAAELRVKESDRIATVAAELRKMGARIDERPDGMVIHGPARLHGAVVECHRDHRLAMALAVAGLVADGRNGRAGRGGHRRLLPELRRGDAGAGSGYPMALGSSGRIGGTTRLVGVMGWPIAHTLSPRMQNAAFAALGLDFAYVPLPVAPERLPDAVRGLAALGFAGANVTVPHKAGVVPFLAEMSPIVRALGAANTLLVRAGRLALRRQHRRARLPGRSARSRGRRRPRDAGARAGRGRSGPFGGLRAGRRGRDGDGRQPHGGARRRVMSTYRECLAARGASAGRPRVSA